MSKLHWPFDAILPIVYNDALTMQENLQMLFDKTNEVIENADSVQDLVYKILQAYVTDYTVTLSYDKNLETINFDLTLSILQQPENITVTEEATEVTIYSYIAGATGYRWEYSVDNGNNWFPSSEKGSDTFQMTTLALTDRNNWLWRVFAWNDTRNMYSDAVSIKVDVNGGGDKPEPSPNPKPTDITIEISYQKNSDTLGYIPAKSYVIFEAKTRNADFAVLEYSDDNGISWKQGLQQQLDPINGYFADGWPMYVEYNMRKWRCKAWNNSGQEVYADYELEVIQ